MNDQQHVSLITEERACAADTFSVANICESFEVIMRNTPSIPGMASITAKIADLRRVLEEVYGKDDPLKVTLGHSHLYSAQHEAAWAVQKFFDCNFEVATAVVEHQIKLINKKKMTPPVGMFDPGHMVNSVYDSRFGINPNAVPNKFEYWYLDLLMRLVDAESKGDRTGTGTHSITHQEYKHDLRESFPFVRSRWMRPESPAKELEWMISGSNNEKDLAAMDVPFWSEFADETGNLGPVYGYLWRHWPNGDGTETDQLATLQHLLKHEPNSRRMIINCWHPTFIPDSKTAPKDNYKVGKQALTPCHYSINVLTQPMSFADRMQWIKENRKDWFELLYPVSGAEWTERCIEKMDNWGVPSRYLDLKFIMRSSDTVLGLPANFNFYGHMAIALAKEVNMVPRFLCYSGMDVHMYVNHIKGVREQLEWAKNNPYKVFGSLARVEYNVPVGTPITEFDHRKCSVIGFEKENIGPFKRFPIAV